MVESSAIRFECFAKRTDFDPYDDGVRLTQRAWILKHLSVNKVNFVAKIFAGDTTVWEQTTQVKRNWNNISVAYNEKQATLDQRARQFYSGLSIPESITGKPGDRIFFGKTFYGQAGLD